MHALPPGFAPATVKIAVRPLIKEYDGSLIIEGAPPKGAASRRLREFQTGRLLARELLGEIDPVKAVFPARTKEGAPKWPGGTVGSITHSGELCAVAVASASDHGSLGLDMERVDRVHPKLWRMMFTDGEKRFLGKLPEERGLEAASAVFSAKESFYKFQHPLSGEYLGFHDVEASLPTDGEIRLRVIKPDAAAYRPESYIGRYCHLPNGYVLALFL